MASKGIGTSFKLGNSASPSTPQDVSSYLNDIGASNDVARLDATTFQPDVPSPLKVEINGFTTRGYRLGGIWSKAADDFFVAIEGTQDVPFEYGPDGRSSGDQKIYGSCNVLSYSGPISNVTGIISFTVDLNVTDIHRTTY